MSTYTGTTIDDLDSTTPLENCSPAELNDATRELKSCLKATFGADHVTATGKHKFSLLTKSATYTATVGDSIILMEGSKTVQLYAASGNSGKLTTIINIGTGEILVDGNASEEIDGSITLALHPNEGVTLHCDASNWYSNRKKPAFRGAMVTNSAALTVTYNTVVVLSFDTESYDTDGIHSTATLTTRLSVPTGVSKVRLYGDVVWISGVTNERVVYIRKNGTTTIFRSVVGVTTTTQQENSVQSPVYPVTGGTDYFELLTFHTHSATTNLATSVTFAMEIIE